ncbi:MAG: AraC family transcriptional regulator [Clostridiales bacterium GWC2_40_7]|nr:MAG: AraC family transcriptional regulator [Clostridiales bacterium GWC2_40_7]
MQLSIDADIMPAVRLIGRIAYKKPWCHFTRTINEYVFYVIKSGEMYIREGDNKFVLKQGETLLLHPNIPHTGYQESCCDYYYVHFKHPGILETDNKTEKEKIQEMMLKRKLSLTGDSLSEDPPTDSISYLPKHYRLINENEIFYLLQEAFNDFYNRYENYKKLVSCKFLDILIRICREYTTSEIENMHTHFSKSFVKVRSVLNHLNMEYHRKITSEDIEQLFESNFDYLNRVFHKMSGYTIFNYLNVVRIKKAKELIETTPIKFAEIGYLVGIEDQYYFSKLFKKHTGITPTQYWKKMNLKS